MNIYLKIKIKQMKSQLGNLTIQYSKIFLNLPSMMCRCSLSFSMNKIYNIKYINK